MSQALFLLTLSAVSLSAANPVTSPKVFGLEFTKTVKRTEAGPLYRRGTVLGDISNEQIYYQANVTIGSPPQTFGIQLDTGSSDLWVPAASSDICAEPQSCLMGSFDYTQSKSFDFLPEAPHFEISYVDGSKILGDYFTDVLQMGSSTVKKLQMGLAQSSPSRDFGIMGIGFKSGEAVSELYPEEEYPNIVNQLKNQGLIKTLGYSLWLNDLESSSGSILFGGVDTEKYHGDLTVLSIQPDSRTGDISSMTVVLSAVSMVNKDGKDLNTQNDVNIPVILDCGSTDTFLPDNMVQPILAGVGAVADEDLDFVVPCKLGTTGATVSFKFGGSSGPVITVDISEFVRPIPDRLIEANNGKGISFSDGTPACIWGLKPAGGRPNLFGDTFLRSAYVVYDLETEQIALAQTNFNTTKSNVVEFSNKDIPNASATASGVVVTQTYSGIAGVPTEVETPAAGATQIGKGPPKPTYDLGGKSASVSLQAPRFEVATFVAGAVVLVSFVFGSSILYVM